jgi:hypothetical protein
VTRCSVATIFGRGLEESGRELAAVTLSVVEIYCETIRCLLTGKEVTLRQSQRSGLLLDGAGEHVSVFVNRSSRHSRACCSTPSSLHSPPPPPFDNQACGSEDEMMTLFNAAKARRAIGETRANARSSRSHLVVRIRLEVLELAGSDDACAAGGALAGGAQGVAFGVLNLVDLAGSERVEKSGSCESKSLMREAQNINKSLLCLGNVVNALAERAEGKKVHIPFR